MGESERNQLRLELDELYVQEDKTATNGGYDPRVSKVVDVITRSVLLLDESNEKLSKSSNELSKVNMRLGVAVLLFTVIQGCAAAVQLYATARGIDKIVTSRPAIIAPDTSPPVSSSR